MKKLLLLIFLAAFCKSQSQTIQLVTTPKNPGTSFALSAVLPGSGQMYNDQVTLGLGVFFVDIALIGSGARLLSMYNKDLDYQSQGNKTMGLALISTGGILYLAQLVHAPLYSQRLNKKRGFITAGITNTGVGLTYKF